MKNFTDECTKCGSDDVKIEHIPYSPAQQVQTFIHGLVDAEEIPEHIDCKCSRCGYEWECKPFSEHPGLSEELYKTIWISHYSDGKSFLNYSEDSAKAYHTEYSHDLLSFKSWRV